jgi:hypothetical protein
MQRPQIARAVSILNLVGANFAHDYIQDSRLPSQLLENEPDSPLLHHEMLAPSATFKFIMNIQLTLILFLGASWLCGQGDRRK